MAALFLTALIALIGFTATGVLADSGLRWWSAFGRLRQEMAMEMARDIAPTLPAARVSVGYSRFGRTPVRPRHAQAGISRAAA